MVNQTLLDIIDTQILLPHTWQYKCLANLNETGFDWQHGLVNASGKPTPALVNATWGITIEVCEKFCNSGKIPFSLDLQSFSSSMTNYFLPWLALTAQLPFETGDFLTNAMAFCMAVGSPALVTYSLTITILNRYWVRKEFAGLQSKAKGDAVHSKFGSYRDRVKACGFLLQEAQQVPLRASMENGWFSSLIVVPANSRFWRELEERLKATRRWVTASLVSQMAFAGIAYLFTIIASFQASLGDPATALQIASGSLWIWLIPVIAGWITVGTQYSHRSIQDALESTNAQRAMPIPIQTGHELSEPPSQQAGLVVRPGLNPLPHSHPTVPGAFEVSDSQRLQIPTWLGAEVGGDEQLRGPIFNYARLFTWWQLASTIDAALFATMDCVANDLTCPPNQSPSLPSHWRAATHILGDSRETAAYCGLDTSNPIVAYPEWSDIPSKIYRRMFAASFIALFLQWGTTGASLLIAFRTPTVGLGCRSASYTLYGILGTASWCFLVISMLLSHEVMLRYQREHKRHPTLDFRRHSKAFTRSFSHGVLCGLAVSFRFLGKLFAIANTLWLLASSLMEFTGGYNNCWCMGNYIGMGMKGWVVLFKGADDLAAAATLPWGGGLALTLLVCFASYTFFFFGSLKTEDD